MPLLDDWLVSLPDDILRPEWDGSILESVSITILKSCLLSGFHNQSLLTRLNNLLVEFFGKHTTYY